jgi:glycosyltransferase involved in cell wall biosynthesis
MEKKEEVKANRKGLLFVINALEPGGAEMFLVRLAEHLQQHFDIHVLSLFPEKDDLAFITMMQERFTFQLMPRNPKPIDSRTDYVFWKLNAIAFHLGSKGLYARLMKMRRDAHLRNELRKRKISAINSSSSTSDHFAVHQLKRLSGIPVLITMHSSYNPEVWPSIEPDRKDFFDMAKSIFDKADSILYTANRNIEIFQKFNNYCGPKPEKQYMGYEAPLSFSNIRQEYGIGSSDFLISMVARGAREKGWIEAITAFRQLRIMHPNAWLILVCPFTEHILELKRTVSQDEQIIFTGYMSNPIEVMCSSDCTILPSHYPESLPYSIIESLGAGRPVFATPIAEIPIMLETSEGMAGALISLNKDGLASIPELTDELFKAATDKAYLTALQNRSKLAFVKFSMAHCGNHYKEALQHLINAKG